MMPLDRKVKANVRQRQQGPFYFIGPSTKLNATSGAQSNSSQDNNDKAPSTVVTAPKRLCEDFQNDDNISGQDGNNEALLGVASLPKRICYNPQNDDSIPGHYLEGQVSSSLLSAHEHPFLGLPSNGDNSTSYQESGSPSKSPNMSGHSQQGLPLASDNSDHNTAPQPPWKYCGNQGWKHLRSTVLKALGIKRTQEAGSTNVRNMLRLINAKLLTMSDADIAAITKIPVFKGSDTWFKRTHRDYPPIVADKPGRSRPTKKMTQGTIGQTRDFSPSTAENVNVAANDSFLTPAAELKDASAEYSIMSNAWTRKLIVQEALADTRLVLAESGDIVSTSKPATEVLPLIASIDELVDKGVDIFYNASRVFKTNTSGPPATTAQHTVAASPEILLLPLSPLPPMPFCDHELSDQQQEQLRAAKVELVKYLQYVKSKDYPHLRPQNVLDEFEFFTIDETANRLIAGWYENLPKLLLFGKGWQEAGLEMFSDNSSHGWGNYFDFLKVMADLLLPERMMVYGGLATGARGFTQRFEQHRKPSVHKAHPSLHYWYFDLPGTISRFRIVAQYQEDSLCCLNEGFLVGSLVLWEFEPYVKGLFAAGMRTPAILEFLQRGVGSAMIGLNRSAGMEKVGYSPEMLMHSSNIQFDKKAKAYITTGQLHSLSRSSPGAGMEIQLFGCKIRVPAAWDDRHPDFAHHTEAILFISLSPGTKHPNCFYRYDEDGKDDGDAHLRQYGIWLQLVGGRGIWFRSLTKLETFNCTAGGRGVGGIHSSKVREARENAMKKYELAKSKAKQSAEVIIRIYNLESGMINNGS